MSGEALESRKRGGILHKGNDIRDDVGGGSKIMGSGSFITLNRSQKSDIYDLSQQIVSASDGRASCQGIRCLTDEAGSSSPVCNNYLDMRAG